MSACACMGPPGDCPCIRKSKGLQVPVTEAIVSPEVWNSMTPEEQKTINDIKLHAALRYTFKKQ